MNFLLIQPTYIQNLYDTENRPKDIATEVGQELNEDDNNKSHANNM
jgi:hypothetical protein